MRTYKETVICLGQVDKTHNALTKEVEVESCVLEAYVDRRVAEAELSLEVESQLGDLTSRGWEIDEDEHEGDVGFVYDDVLWVEKHVERFKRENINNGGYDRKEVVLHLDTVSVMKYTTQAGLRVLRMVLAFLYFTHD